MRLIGEILLIAVNVLMAYHHSNLIGNSKPIKHGIWGGLYLIFAGVISWLNKSWELFACSLVVRKVYFDLSLNLFRGKPLFYVSSSTTSIIDRLHYRIFGLNSVPYMLFYFISSIVFAIYFSS